MTNDYQLLDFGGGRRLERFGPIVLDRPCPSAERFEKADPAAWQHANARFDGRDQEKGIWTDRRELPERWTIQFGTMQFELKRTAFGHLGIFPEQAENWNWIAERCRLPASQIPPKPLKVLNLFAYTGGSTLAAACDNVEVVHVDAAKNIVAWARRNAEFSGLAATSIRWITEDAMKFVKRELRRGNRYNAVILDPPSYGHGAHGEVWRLSKHLPRLLSLCAELTQRRPEFMLLTCHTPGYDAKTLRQMMEEAFGEGDIAAGPLTIRSVSGRDLPCGVFVRYRKQ